MFTKQDLDDAEASITSLTRQRDLLRIELSLAYVKLKKIKKAGVDYAPVTHQAQVFDLPSQPAPKHKYNVNLKDWTADQIIAANLKRAEDGLPPMWGSEEALENLAKQPPAD